MSSPTNPIILSCFGCKKIYKSRGALIKHQSKCSATAVKNITNDITENITTDIVESETVNIDNPVDNDNNGVCDQDRHHCVVDVDDHNNHIIPPEIQREFKEQLQAFMNSKEPLPRIEPIKSENILVNTAVIDSLMKSVITELFDHQHKQMQTILQQNKKLAEENKMLIKVLRSIVLARHNDGTISDLQQTNNDDSDDSS